MNNNNLPSIIEYYRNYNYSRCKKYTQDKGCVFGNACFCKKLGETWGYINHLVPKEYRNKSIEDINGYAGDQKVWSDQNAKEIYSSIMNYLFGESYKNLTDTTDRVKLNKSSILSKRRKNGDNLIIHGRPYRTRHKNDEVVLDRSVSMGKTMLAYIVLIEAIWQKMEDSSNTYHFEPYQILRNRIINKDNDDISELKHVDWLFIDDVMKTGYQKGYKHQEFLTVFDDLFITRIQNNLPTILVCDFKIDTTAQDFTEDLGYGFQKLITANNSLLINVGE